MHEGSVLLLEKQADDKSFWGAPGGRINKGELSKVALKRELEEALIGISDIEIRERLGVDILDDVLLDDAVGLVLVYSRIQVSSKEFRLSSEHAGMRWVESSVDIPDGINSPVLESIIRDILDE